jgi:alcohol dehydrogenase class IV
MRFEFTAPQRIIFGPGVLSEAPKAVAEFGRRALLVTGRDPLRGKALADQLRDQGIQVTQFAVPGEPELKTVEAGVALGRQEGVEVVIGFGGGSALDAGKAIAAMLTNPGSLLDYLEVIGRAQPLAQTPAPFIAIPTTAGTGTEATRNAVLASPEHQVKVSLRHPLMLARVAIVDPQLTRGLPPAIAAATGLDALTQLLEPYVCARPNPMVDALCRDGLVRAGRSLKVVCSESPTDAAREDMSLAALFGGIALANAGLGAVHGFAGPIGGMFPAPHGAVCAALLAQVTRVNLRALRERHPDHPAIDRYGTAYRWLSDETNDTPESLPPWLSTLTATLQIPGLASYGLRAEHIPAVVEKARQASSMKANPVALTTAELAEILEKSL